MYRIVIWMLVASEPNMGHMIDFWGLAIGQMNFLGTYFSL